MLSVHWLRWGCAEFKGSPSIDIDILSHVILCKITLGLVFRCVCRTFCNRV